MAALLAVLLRALIPAGYMPDFRKHDAFQLVICTADGAHKVITDDAYAPVQKTPVPHKEKPCDFSLTAFKGQAVLAQSFAIALLVFAAAFLTARKEFSLSRRRYYSAASPRAPPAFL